MQLLTTAELEALAANIGNFTPEEQAQIAIVIEELERRQQTKKCQDSLIEFCKYMDPTYVVAPHHKRLAELLTQIAYGHKDRIAVSIPPRHGKLCADSTPVLTPSGWKTHGELAVGDLVYGPDGVPTRVLAISEPGIASVEFEFSNGDTIKVHENHEWTLFYKPAKQWMTLESRKFSEPMRDPRGQGRMRAIWTGKRGERGSKALWRLPKISPIQCQTKELPLDPYVFGVWLGDGTAGKTTVTMGAEDFKYILPAFEEVGWARSATFIHKDTGVPTISFGSGRMGVKSAFKLALEATGACYVKRIPEAYKRGSVEQRLELLAGLIDTDGHVELGTSRVRIVTVSEMLAQDIAEVATTLGFAPYITTQEPSLSSSGIQGREIVYTVGFQPRCPVPTRIPRKKITGEVRQDRDPSLIEVRKATNPEVGRCIQVDRDDGLYLVGRNLTPTHNSHLVSTLFPAWFLGKFPDKKVLMVSHTGDLAVDFGRKVRNIIADTRYTSVFPGITLAQDSKSAGRWDTNRGGSYYACGVGAALAGRGADLLLVDDPHSEQDLLSGNFDELEKAYQWFAFGARTRLMSEGRIAVIHTRWHQMDLIGHLIQDGANNPKADQYEVFEFPAVITIENSDKTVVEKALWPEKFDLDALERTKASMPLFQWNAQYMQNPTGEQGAILQRDWWQKWERDEPPQCEYIIMALDAAAEKNNRADFTALLTFGVFSDDNLTDGASHIILLNAINTRVEFPELKDLAIREWTEWEPDAFIVEKKSSGTPLYQELRRMGIPVQEFVPHRGTGDKIARLNAVADIVRSGMVWYPAGRRWAEEVIEQAVAFPYGAHDDMVDCLSMILSRFRQGGFVRLPSDYQDSDLYPQRRAAYY